MDEWVKFIEIINSSTDITSKKKKYGSPNFDERELKDYL